MEACEQAPGLNMLGHGRAVHEKYRAIVSALDAGSLDCPELARVYDRYRAGVGSATQWQLYHTYHDCGKHLCLTVSSDGKRQFPDHAAASAEQFGLLFPDEHHTRELIALDMGFHVLRGPELLALCRHPLAPILYLTAWAEIQANAVMFGGLDSESYKIKRSRLIQAGKKLLHL